MLYRIIQRKGVFVMRPRLRKATFDSQGRPYNAMPDHSWYRRSLLFGER